MASTPLQGLVVEVATGGDAVIVFPANISGGYITNPYAAADQGLSDAELLYVDPVNTPGAAPGDGNTTTTVLYPGQSYSAVPGQTTETHVNAPSSGHLFVAVYWL